MEDSGRRRTYRFAFDGSTEAPAGTVLVTEPAMTALGYKNTGTFRGFRQAFSSVCSLIDAIPDEDVSYVDVTEEQIPQPDSGGYRIRRRLSWPGGRSAAEETDGTETDVLHSIFTSVQEYPEGQAPEGTISYTDSDGIRRTADMSPFGREQREILIRCLNSGRDPSLLLSLNPDGTALYDAGQMSQVLTALTKRLTGPELLLVSNPRFSAGQMRQIRLGLISDGLGLGEVNIYANPAYSEIRMEQLRLALKDGLGSEAVKALSDPSLDDAQILLARLTCLKDMPEKPAVKITTLYGSPEKADPADVEAFSDSTGV